MTKWRLILRQLRWSLLLAVLVLTVSSAGYVVLDGWGWLDAFYMSVITIGQVGFNEVRPLDTSGKIWTIAMIVSGFAVFVYSSAALTALFLSGDVRAAVHERRSAKVRQQLHDHVVVIGFGRVGRSATEAALRSGHQVVVVDNSGTPNVAERVEGLGAVYLSGDARDVTVLRHAGARRAAALITTLDDPSNAVVALTARSISPTLRIVARVADITWGERLMRAGASHVVPVYESIGTSLAATALNAEVLGVLPVPGTDMRVEEIEVGPDSLALGLDLPSLMHQVEGVHILGLRRNEGIIRWHEADAGLMPGDVLVALGSATALDGLTGFLHRPD